jgi:hypothetical protein
MRRAPVSWDALLEAYRETTAVQAAGGAAADPTRARVLAKAGRGTERRLVLRRTAGGLALLLVLGSTASAVTVVGRRWVAPAPVVLAGLAGAGAGETAGGARLHAGAARAARVIPTEVPGTAPDPAPGTADTQAEARAYGRAHRAHFIDDKPARALAAWNDYLAAYPDGTFAPEARYNRAICLARLGRRADAERALRPFAEGRYDARFGAYRRQEARLLLDWLRARRR